MFWNRIDRHRRRFHRQKLSSIWQNQISIDSKNCLRKKRSRPRLSINIGRIQNSLGYTNLTADSDGIISAINAEAGQIVAAGQTICTLTQTAELEVSIDVPENRLSEVEIGSEVTVDFWAVNGRFTGIVRELSPIADSATRTFNAKISLPNPPANLQLGMTASVQTFDSKISDGSVEIPIASIFQTESTPQVWIVESNRVSKKSIEVISLSEKFARVKGLNPGSIIVTAGVHKLVDGQSIRLEGESQ